MTVIFTRKLPSDMRCVHRICNESVSHLLYMDNLKFFVKGDQHLETLLTIINQFSDDKYAKITFLKVNYGIQSDMSTIIEELNSKVSYKHLGMYVQRE